MGFIAGHTEINGGHVIELENPREEKAKLLVLDAGKYDLGCFESQKVIMIVAGVVSIRGKTHMPRHPYFRETDFLDSEDVKVGALKREDCLFRPGEAVSFQCRGVLTILFLEDA